MNLLEIRAKHPEYDDVADDVLVSALHKKHYPDIDFDVFSEAIGYKRPPEPPGLFERGKEMVGGAIEALRPIGPEPTFEDISPEAVAGAEFEGIPEETDILGMAKTLGKTGLDVAKKIEKLDKIATEKFFEFTRNVPVVSAIDEAATDFILSVGRGAARKLVPPALDWELAHKIDATGGLSWGGEPIRREELIDHFVNPQKHGTSWSPMTPEDADQFIRDQENLELVENLILIGALGYGAYQGVRNVPAMWRALKGDFAKYLWENVPKESMLVGERIRRSGLKMERLAEIHASRGKPPTEKELTQIERIASPRKFRGIGGFLRGWFGAGKPTEAPPTRALPGPPSPKVAPEAPKFEIVPKGKAPSEYARTATEYQKIQAGLKKAAEVAPEAPKAVTPRVEVPPEKPISVPEAPVKEVGIQKEKPIEAPEIGPEKEISLTEATTYQGKRMTTLMGPEDNMIVAKGPEGKDIGYLWYSKEPEGGFTVRKVETIGRGTGAGRMLYREAFEKEGPYRGSTDRTLQGKAFVNRLMKTEPDIFAEYKAIKPPVVEEKPTITPTKEPWEMTRDEFEQGIKLAIKDTSTGKIYRQQLPHERIHADMFSRLERQGVRAEDMDVGFVRPDGSWISRYDRKKRQAGFIPPKFEEREPYKYVVQKALSEGKPVPPEVLAEYPDLGKLRPTTVMEAELRAKKRQVGKPEEIPPEKMREGLFAEERKQMRFEVPAKPIPGRKPPEEARTFVEYIKRTGGIWDPSLRGEMREFTSRESRIMGLVRKGGQPFDTLVAQAIEDGWLPEGSTGDDLREFLRQDIMAMKQKGPRMQPYRILESKEWAKEWKKHFEVQEDQTKLDAGATDAHTETLSFMGTGQIPRVAEDMVKDILHYTGIKDKDPDGITLSAKDLREIYTYIQMPDDIRRTFPEFNPIYEIQRARECQKAVLDREFAEATKPYFELGPKDRAAVDKILLEGEQTRNELYTEEELKKVYGLTDKQINGYMAIRENLNTARRVLIDKMKDFGIKSEVIDDFSKTTKGYIPHKWYGRWAIVAKGKEGKTDFMTATNYYDRYIERDRVKKLYPDHEVIVVKRSKIPYEAFQEAPSFAVQKMVDLATEKASLDPDVKDAMVQALADLYKSKGFGMHFIQRKGIPGYTEDLARPLAEYFSGFTGYITKMEAIKAFPEAIKPVSPRRTPNLYRYSIDYINYVTGDPLEFKTAKNLAYFWYLFGNVKSASLNLTQNFVLGWPVLSKHTKLALPKLMRSMTRTASGLLSKDQKEFIASMEKAGYLDPKASQEISGYSGNPLYKPLRGLGGKAISLLDVFRHAEGFNRRSMAIACYDAGIRDVEEAARIIEEAHFHYAKGNRPRLARGIVSPLMTFRSWYINYLTWLKNQIKAGKISPLAKSLFALIMIGGLAALPGYEQLKKAYTKYFGMDPETEARKVLGKRWGRDLMHGSPSEIGVEFSGSVGMGDIIPTNLKEVGGVFADIPTRGKKIGKALRSGDYKRALEDAAPEALRNPLAAYRLYTQGATSRGGRPVLDLKTGKPLKITKGEAYRKVLGYYPTRLAEQYGISETLETVREQRMEKKRELADRYRIALLNKDRPEMKRVIADLQAYNLKMRKRGRWEDQIRLKEFKQMLELRERPLGKPPKYMRPKLQKLREQY